MAVPMKGAGEGGRKLGDDSAVDVFEQEGALVVEVGLPGVRQEDICVKAEGCQLLIGARRPDEDGPRRYRIRGRRLLREYNHDLMLPPEAATEHATATYLRGLLRVRIPLAAGRPAPIREIEVGA